MIVKQMGLGYAGYKKMAFENYAHGTLVTLVSYYF